MHWGERGGDRQLGVVHGRIICRDFKLHDCSLFPTLGWWGKGWAEYCEKPWIILTCPHVHPFLPQENHCTSIMINQGLLQLWALKELCHSFYTHITDRKLAYGSPLGEVRLVSPVLYNLVPTGPCPQYSACWGMLWFVRSHKGHPTLLHFQMKGTLICF